MKETIKEEANQNNQTCSFDFIEKFRTLCSTIIFFERFWDPIFIGYLWNTAANIENDLIMIMIYNLLSIPDKESRFHYVICNRQLFKCSIIFFFASLEKAFWFLQSSKYFCNFYLKWTFIISWLGKHSLYYL